MPQQIIKTMKTTISITALLLSLSLALQAQNNAPNKACIKMDIIQNGKETKMDTCFNIAMGDSIEKMFMNIHWDSLSKKFAEIRTQMGGLNIEIDSSSGPNGKKQIVKIISSKDGKDNEITIKGDGGEGNSANAYTYSSDSNGKVVVKTSANGNGSSIAITEEDGDVIDPKGNTFKVYILKKVEVTTLSADDKKQLPEDVTSTLSSSKPFSNLVMWPNPTEGNVRITYKSTSTGHF